MEIPFLITLVLMVVFIVLECPQNIMIIIHVHIDDSTYFVPHIRTSLSLSHYQPSRAVFKWKKDNKSQQEKEKQQERAKEA